ncbi:MAG TPA: protease modulator HflK N-terminal domain-containing protein, partial [Pelagibacteraceae bacterium]|nr:protease modulator HflK N-terminal domain-containing protein [Pelagibacteraceae bacterium]
MANNDDFGKGGSPWGSPGGGGNGSGRKGPTPPNIDEIVNKIQDLVKKFIPGNGSGKKPIIL